MKKDTNFQRLVAKYREKLKIPIARLRKQIYMKTHIYLLLAGNKPHYSRSSIRKKLRSLVYMLTYTPLIRLFPNVKLLP
jgi:hypothetical protein